MPITDTRPATDRQRSFLADLVKDREWKIETVDGDVYETCMNSMVPDMFIAKSEASAAIDALLKCPKVARRQPASDFLAALPACKYIVTGDAGQRVHVEVVERRGGRKFLNVLIGHPGDWSRQRVAIQTQRSLAEKIRTASYTDGARDLTGPEAAAVRFSREFTCCAACMSPLSDETSVRLGLGPVCRTRFEF